MSGQDKTSVVNVGIYGCTKAGKTRFLFQLLSRWERTHRVLSMSENCRKFIKTVQGEIDTHGDCIATQGTTEDIRVKISREGNDPPCELVFRDLRGELLTGEIDQIDSLQRTGIIPTQVRQCDAFLFIFDPFSSENPAHRDRHHQQELKRATLFIEYVLNIRENRHLPIIFVLTHLDVWENDPEVCDKVERWTNEVHKKLKELYDDRLRHQYPPSLVDRDRIFFRVSSVGKTPEADKQLEKVIEQVSELVAESAKYRGSLQKPGYRAVAFGGIFVLCFFSLIISLLALTHGPPPNGPKPVAEWSEKDINEKLDELNLLLKVPPSGQELPSVADAENINGHLRWLAIKLKPDSGGMTNLSEKTRQRMKEAFERVVQLIHDTANSKRSPDVLTPVLEAYLKELPDMAPTFPVLAEVQKRYWQLQREQVVKQLAIVLRRRHNVRSPPLATLDEVLEKLGDSEKKVQSCKVSPEEIRNNLLTAIQTAKTFCEDRRKAKCYPVTIQVVSAIEVTPTYGRSWHNLRITTPDRDDWLTRDGIALIRPESGDSPYQFRTKQKEYSAELGMGSPVKLILSFYDDVNKKWNTRHELLLTTQEGPLAPLGLPLLTEFDQKNDQGVLQPKTVMVRLQQERMTMTLDLKLDFPGVPSLLVEAGKLAKEGNP